MKEMAQVHSEVDGLTETRFGGMHDGFLIGTEC